MAEQNEGLTLPTVQPTTQGINVRASPEAFGAPIAKGLEQLGTGINKAADFYGEVAADNATNNWHKKVENILYGDPNDPDNSPGYFNMKGADAMNARPQVMKELEDAANEQRNTLFTPESKFQFDQDTRRTRFLTDQQIGSHYEQQKQQWGLKTNEDKLQAAEDAIARNPNDPATLSLSLTQAREAAIATAQLTRGSGFDAKAEIEKADQIIRLKQLDALRVTDPQAALDLLTKADGGKVLRSLPNYASLVHQVQEDAVNASTAKSTDKNIANWTGKAAQSISTPQQLQQHSTVPPAQYNNAIAGVDPKYRNATGIILAGETQHDAASAGPNGDYHVAGVGQFTVDQWKTVTGQTIAPGDVGVKGKDPRLDPNASIHAIGLEMQQDRDAYFKRFGREPTAGDLALMHQQGQAGGLKLFSALIDNPNAPAANYVSEQALANNGFKDNAATVTVAQAVRGISDYYMKGHGGSFGGAGATGQYPSQSDFLIAHLPDAVEQYRNEIEDDPAFAGREDLVDRAVNSFENRYRRQIRDQNQQYIVDMHQIQSVIAQGYYTSWNDVMAISPEMAATSMRLLWENPQAYHEMDNWFKANAGGAAKSFGTQFSNVLDRVLAPVGDPQRIEDPAQINSMIGRGENALITNTGGAVLQGLLQARNQPNGENDIAQLRGYLNTARPWINPLEKESLGTISPTGRARFERFVGQVLPLVAQERSQGEPMSEILAKGGAVDKLLVNAMGDSKANQQKDKNNLVHDPRIAPEKAAQDYLRKSADLQYLKDGIAQNKISPAQAAWGIKMGARSVQQLQDAYRAGMINRKDAEEAFDHLTQYHRNFYGQPEL